MNLVALSMRAAPFPERSEVSDSIDRQWYALLECIGLVPCLVPNDCRAAATLIDRLAPDAVLLSGGGDIAAVSGERNARDHVEGHLLAWARQSGRRVLGVCRGMQAIVDHAGGRIHRADGHVRVRHGLLNSTRVVNSFHEYVVKDLPVGLRALERAEDGSVEACISDDARLLGLMWHPEREYPFHATDLELIAHHLGGRQWEHRP